MQSSYPCYLVILFSPRILAISSSCYLCLFFWSLVLFSRFSGSVFFVLSGLIEGCWGHGHANLAPSYPQKIGCLKSSGSGPDLSDYLSSLETSLKTTKIPILIKSGWPGFLLKSSPPHINADPPGVGIFHKSPGHPDRISQNVVGICGAAS